MGPRRARGHRSRARPDERAPRPRHARAGARRGSGAAERGPARRRPRGPRAGLHRLTVATTTGGPLPRRPAPLAFAVVAIGLLVGCIAAALASTVGTADATTRGLLLALVVASICLWSLGAASLVLLRRWVSGPI